MISPVVKAVDGGTSVYDKTASELQSDIMVGDDAITGTLKTVEGYAAFGAGEQDGHFLALSLDADGDEVEITTELVGGVHGEVAVNDGFCVYRITNKNTQSVRVTFTKDDESVTKTYSLSGLILE